MCDTMVVCWEISFKTLGEVNCAETEVNVVDGPEELATVMPKEVDWSLMVKEVADDSSLDGVAIHSYTPPLNGHAPM